MGYFERHVLESLVYLPMLTALVLLALPAKGRSLIRGVGIASGALALGGSLYAFVAYDQGAGGFQLVRVYPWMAGLGIDFRLGVDGIGALMVLLTGVVTFAASIVAANRDEDPKAYYVLLNLLVAGVYGTFVSTDLFFFFFFYELAIVPMYLLIAMWGSSSVFPSFSRTKEYAALKLVLMIVAASVLVWIGIIAIYVRSEAGTFDIAALSQAAQDGRLDAGFQRWVFPLVMVGFGLLAGMWPFHTWSPDGHVSAPTSVSMLHAGVLMKLGAFGIIRVGMQLLPQGMDDWSLVLFIIGTINVVYGAVSALAQTDLKYVIGYSSVSHMGYVLMGLGTLDSVGVTGASLQMFSHGVMTALFFTLVGAIYERSHTRDSLVLNGLASRMGWASGLFILAGLASLGLPGLSGFVAEVLVFVGAFRTEPVLGAIGIAGAAITAVYILRLVGRVFFGTPDKQWDHLHDLNLREGIAAASLVIPVVVVGIFPAPFLDVLRPGVAAVLAGIGG
ncbi:MAG: NADH-quinone oxidoreductase subunit M [Chloroflexota bacterium]